MDAYVQEKLIQWKLESFVERFNQAGIDEDVFENMLDESLINELFDKTECGYKKKFKNYYDRWKSLKVNFDKRVESNVPVSLPNFDETNENEIQATNTLPLTETRNFQTDDELVNRNEEVTLITVMRKTVQELLTTTTQGKLILQMFKKEKLINTRSISSLLINYEFDSTSSYRITKERFIELSRELGTIFVSEDKTAEEIEKLFYFPYRRATQIRSAVNTGGVLYEKYLNLRSKLLEFEVINKDESIKEDTLLTVNEEAIKWLQENDHPEDEVTAKWKETYFSRDRCKNVENYFALYKCVGSSFGHNLLVIDFDFTYPNSKDKLTEKWAEITPLIISIARERKKLDRDTALICGGKEGIAALLYLPRILGILLRKRKSANIVFGSTIKDVTDSFILIVKSKEDLVAFKNKRKEISISTGSKILPYVVFAGSIEKEGEEDNEEIQTHVIINDMEFEVNSNKIIDAVACCYKCMISLNLNFPAECRHVWVFLQQYVFEMENIGKPYTAVNKLIEDLNILKIRENIENCSDPANGNMT